MLLVGIACRSFSSLYSLLRYLLRHSISVGLLLLLSLLTLIRSICWTTIKRAGTGCEILIRSAELRLSAIIRR